MIDYCNFMDEKIISKDQERNFLTTSRTYVSLSSFSFYNCFSIVGVDSLETAFIAWTDLTRTLGTLSTR